MPVRPKIRIRRARRDDLPLLVAHRRRMWEAIRDHPTSALDAADRTYARWVRRMQAERRFIGWIASSTSGEVAGSGCLWLAEAQPRPLEPERWRPYILSMYTVPAYRGRGVASAVVRAAVRHARAAGYPRVTLHASVMGRSVYRSLGFERTWEMRRVFAAPAARAAPRRRRGRSARATAG
jgi:ribosomal protein S18 acetylase RimI-like enzyme